MKLAALITTAAVLLAAAAFHFRYSYTTVTASGTLPVVYVVRVDHWTGRASVAWMMGNNYAPRWVEVQSAD